ncbi:hypothetical protein GBC03_17170 [Citrobacter telavivensis]|uniref:Uncharacterized protein n=1 Tax=Citrobacter telavivensis TaxID=2653932 RepID=A0A6L5E4X9_9ENTR|nr:hypothetical protein [Citrobacter telavivensis]QFS71810.1 hypothetical protein GBC03_17170 [Citrobacter telavivensis]
MKNVKRKQQVIYPRYFNCPDRLFVGYAVIYTRHTSSCRCVGCARSPQSLTRVSSRRLMRDILSLTEGQPAAGQIRSRRICHSHAA